VKIFFMGVKECQSGVHIICFIQDRTYVNRRKHILVGTKHYAGKKIGGCGFGEVVWVQASKALLQGKFLHLGMNAKKRRY
jgi:hypothetical protein